MTGPGGRMTPDQEARLMRQMLDRLESRRGAEYVEEKRKFLEAEWAWLRELQFFSVADLEE